MNFNIQPTLPIKYAMKVHQALPNYPTHQDFMFEIISYIVRVTEQKEKDWDPNDIKFSAKTLKYIFGDNVKSEEFLDRIKTILKDLIESGALAKRGEFIFISADEFSKYYSIS
jgi:hypothetical protein